MSHFKLIHLLHRGIWSRLSLRTSVAAVAALLAGALLLVSCDTASPFPDLEGPFAQAEDGSCELGVSDAEAYDLIDELLAEIDQLAADGALNSGQARALRNHLTNARRHIQEGRYCPALAQLNAFREQAVNFVDAGVLTDEQAEPLLDGVDQVIEGPMPHRVWLPMGSGFDGTVRALIKHDGAIVAAGEFSASGGLSLNGIGVWDGTTWQPLGSGVTGMVNALVVYEGDLIAAGDFSSAGGAVVNNVARWNGAVWQPLGSGLEHRVNTLEVHDGTLFAGTGPPFGSATTLHYWDGESWRPVRSARAYYSLLSYHGGLLASGIRHNAFEPLSHLYVERWDDGSPTTILELSSAFAGAIRSMGEYQGNLIVGGSFSYPVSTYNIAMWDGETWQGLGGGIGGFLRGEVRALLVFNELLLAAGRSLSPNPEDDGHPVVMAWDGSSWQMVEGKMHSPSIPEVFALAKAGIDLVAGGSIEDIDGVVVNNIARWGVPE